MNALTLNVRNPSVTRAAQQWSWLTSIDLDVLVLTEIKQSAGCAALMRWLTESGFAVEMGRQIGRDFGVLMAVRGRLSSISIRDVTVLPHRFVLSKCETARGTYYVGGVYVPSRGPRKQRNVNKKLFQTEVAKTLKAYLDTHLQGNLVILGDLNVVERLHVPRLAVFGEWEYEFYDSFGDAGLVDAFHLAKPESNEHSWYSRQGRGFRIDHCFVSAELAPQIRCCRYLHDVREMGLSDHSALLVEIG